MAFACGFSFFVQSAGQFLPEASTPKCALQCCTARVCSRYFLIMRGGLPECQLRRRKMYGIAAQSGARVSAQKAQQRVALWQATCLRVALKRPSPALPAWPSVAWRRLAPWRVSFSSATHRSKEREQILVGGCSSGNQRRVSIASIASAYHRCLFVGLSSKR